MEKCWAKSEFQLLLFSARPYLHSGHKKNPKKKKSRLDLVTVPSGIREFKFKGILFSGWTRETVASWDNTRAFAPLTRTRRTGELKGCSSRLPRGDCIGQIILAHKLIKSETHANNFQFLLFDGDSSFATAKDSCDLPWLLDTELVFSRNVWLTD